MPKYMKKILVLLLCVVFAGGVYAQQKVSVCGETRYVVPETQSQSDAKRTAIQRARIQALADEFGTVVSQTNTTTMHNTGEQTKTDFNSFSENEVRGIWIEDTKEPELDMRYENNMLVIYAKVCGKARELKTNAVELDIQTFSYGGHNGESHPSRPGYATTQFKHNDLLGVRFKSPVNGYVAMFIRDDNNDIVLTQLPYVGSDGRARAVKSNKEYIFLNNNDPEFPSDMESVILITDRKIETNTLVIVFSQKEFNLSLAKQGKYFPEMELAKFQKWLHSLRKYDETLQVEEIVLTITK